MIIHCQHIYIQIWFQTLPCFFTLECQVWVIYVPENTRIFCPSNAVWFRLTSLSFFVKKSQISGVVSIRQLSWLVNLPLPNVFPPKNKGLIVGFFFAGLKGKNQWAFISPGIKPPFLGVIPSPKAGRSPSEGRVTYGGGWNRWCMVENTGSRSCCFVCFSTRELTSYMFIVSSVSLNYQFRASICLIGLGTILVWSCLFVCLFVYQKVCFAYICSFCLIIQYTLLLLTLPSIHFLVLKWYTNRMEEAGSQKHMLCFCCPVSCCEFYSLRVTYKLGQQLPLVNCKSLSRWRCSIDFFHINDQWWKNTTSEFQISNGDTLWFIYIYIYIDWY